VNKYTLYTYSVCKGGVWGSGPQTEKHLPQSPFTGEFFQMTTFCIAFYKSYLSTMDIKQVFVVCVAVGGAVKFLLVRLLKCWE
jgi:hypothetical protein